MSNQGDEGKPSTDCFVGKIKSVFEIFEDHKCATTCMIRNPDIKQMKELMKEKKYPYLAMPLVFQWQRLITADSSKDAGKIVKYISPCLKTFNNLFDIYDYLRVTSCNLPIHWFSYSETVNEQNYFVPEFGTIAMQDVSVEREFLPISVINCVDSVLDHESIAKTYITSCTFSDSISKGDDSDFLTCCDCLDDCKDKSKCSCCQLTLQSLDPLLRSKYESLGVDIGYTFSNLYTQFLSGIYECNRKCPCSINTCVNRVAQKEIFVQLQLFKTVNKGWGVRAMHDIARGTFVCNYVGKILTVQKVSKMPDRKDGWKYLANLQVAHPQKEGYEHNVVMPDEETNWINASSKCTVNEHFISASVLSTKEIGPTTSNEVFKSTPTITTSTNDNTANTRADLSILTKSRNLNLTSRNFKSTPTITTPTNDDTAKTRADLSILNKSRNLHLTSRKAYIRKVKIPAILNCCLVGTPIKNNCCIKMTKRTRNKKNVICAEKTLETFKKTRNACASMNQTGRKIFQRKSRVFLSKKAENKGNKALKPQTIDRTINNGLSQQEREIKKNLFRYHRTRTMHTKVALTQCVLKGVPLKLGNWRLLQKPVYNLRPKIAPPGRVRRSRGGKNIKERKIGKYVIDGKKEGNIGRFLNHSCDPNLFCQYVFTESHDINLPILSFFALKDILAGTELTWDYKYDLNNNNRGVIMCHCGSSNCRGRLC